MLFLPNVGSPTPEVVLSTCTTPPFQINIVIGLYRNQEYLDDCIACRIDECQIRRWANVASERGQSVKATTMRVKIEYALDIPLRSIIDDRDVVYEVTKEITASVVCRERVCRV